MAQNAADRVVLVLIHFPTLNLRLPEAQVSECSSEPLSAGGLVPELTSGCPRRACGNSSSGATWRPEVALVCPGDSWSSLKLLS